MNVIAPPSVRPFFALGQIVSTPGALYALKTADVTARELLLRHWTGNWGDLCSADKQENDLSVQQGYRVLSAYTFVRTGVTVWIITEADRSVTTLLLPDEY
jgi:hypothetical protein